MDDETFTIDMTDFLLDITYERNEDTTHNMRNVARDISLKIEESGKDDMSFTFNIDESCSTREACAEIETSCIGNQPHDLIRNGFVIGDIKLCTTGIQVRKNVLNADGTISKVNI